jgi:hypothetical protein
LNLIKKNKEREEVEEFIKEVEQPETDSAKLGELTSQLNELGINAGDLADIIGAIANKKDKEVGEIKNEVIAKANGLRLMQTKTAAGRSGTMAMTGPASERADEIRKLVKKSDSHSYLYKPRKNE